LDRCASLVVDRATGARHRLGSPLPVDGPAPAGVISPDGRTAAVIENDRPGAGIHVIDLDSVSDIVVSLPTVVGTGATMLWSPDSQWLFVTGSGGEFYPVSMQGLGVSVFTVDLPRIRATAVRR